MYRAILIKNGMVATHCWPDAPEEVAFLRNEHRHIFDVITEIEVFHDDRELEFFMVQRNIEQFLLNCGIMESKSTSCEMIAEAVCNYVQVQYGQREVSCLVLEDGENGARVLLNK